MSSSDTKWKWKNHHHNSKAVRKRFSIFFSLFTLHCTFRLYGVPFSPSLSHSLSQRLHSFSFFIFPFLTVYVFGHPSFNFFFSFSSQLKQKSFLNFYAIYAVYILCCTWLKDISRAEHSVVFFFLFLSMNFSWWWHCLFCDAANAVFLLLFLSFCCL